MNVEMTMKALKPTIAECMQEAREFIQNFDNETEELKLKFVALQTPLEQLFYSLQSDKSEIETFQKTFDRVIQENINQQTKYSADIDAIPDTLISGPRL